MLNLAFDTTAGSCSVLLTEDGKTLEKYVKNGLRTSRSAVPGHSGNFTKPAVAACRTRFDHRLLRSGVFTGVRSSLAAARTLGLALQKTALTGVSAFEAYVHDLAPEELAFTMPLLSKPNAKTFYFQCFDDRKNKLGEPEALDYETIVDRLRHKK